MKLKLNLLLVKTNLITCYENPLANTKRIFCFRWVLLIYSLFVVFGSYAQPKMDIKDAKKNFGLVKTGELIKLVYDINNNGNEALIITSTEVSCSCTVVDYPKHPLLPNQAGQITVIFDTKSAYGRQDRVVFVKSNDPKSPAKLRYKGIVLQK